MNRRNYKFTRHLRERYLERTRPKFKHLSHCNQQECQECRDLAMEIDEELRNRRLIDREIANRLNEAVECRAILNDTNFMTWYYDKYGTDTNFEFLVDGDVCFVAIQTEDGKMVVTCVSSKTHKAARQTLRPKYNRKAG